MATQILPDPPAQNGGDYFVCHRNSQHATISHVGTPNLQLRGESLDADESGSRKGIQNGSFGDRERDMGCMATEPKQLRHTSRRCSLSQKFSRISTNVSGGNQRRKHRICGVRRTWNSDNDAWIGNEEFSGPKNNGQSVSVGSPTAKHSQIRSHCRIAAQSGLFLSCGFKLTHYQDVSSILQDCSVAYNPYASRPP